MANTTSANLKLTVQATGENLRNLGSDYEYQFTYSRTGNRGL